MSPLAIALTFRVRIWGFGSSITKQISSTLLASWSQDLVLGYRETKPLYSKWKARGVDMGQVSTQWECSDSWAWLAGPSALRPPPAVRSPPSAPLLTQLCHSQTGFLPFPRKSHVSPYNRWIKGCPPSISLSKFSPFFKKISKINLIPPVTLFDELS